LAREPCAYYLSEYFWGVTNREGGYLWGALQSKSWGKGELYVRKDMLMRPADQTLRDAFSDWVRYIVGTGEDGTGRRTSGCGLLSMRLWTAILNTTAGESINIDWARVNSNGTPCLRSFKGNKTWRNYEGVCPCPLAVCTRAASVSIREQCQHEISISSMIQKFDCWIRTENLFGDFKTCMKRYRDRGGIDVHFTQEIKNRNKYPSCTKMLDNDTANLIYEAEKQYADRFGFSSCCSHIVHDLP